MALPQKIQVNAITGASLPSTIDNDINEGIKQPIIDILGIPDNTNINAAVAEITASGLKNVRFQDAAANPSVAGYLQRNGSLLNFHDGSASRVLVTRDLAESLSNKTISTSTLNSPTISAILNTGTLTLPTSTTTLVGRDTTDTLTNKTINGALLSGNFEASGGYSLIDANIENPAFSGTFTGDYNIGGSPHVTVALDLPGGRIIFPATQAPSGDANTLDDYEEGSWTPSIGGTATYTSQFGTYTKIGRFVQIHCVLQINVRGTGSQTTISGLPFTPADPSGNGFAAAVTDWSGSATNIVWIGAQINNGGTIVIRSLTAAGAAYQNNNFFQNSSLIIIGGCYHV